MSSTEQMVPEWQEESQKRARESAEQEVRDLKEQLENSGERIKALSKIIEAQSDLINGCDWAILCSGVCKPGC